MVRGGSIIAPGDAFKIAANGGFGSQDRLVISVAGVVSIPDLTASMPVQTNGSSALISAAIDLSTSQVTGNLSYLTFKQRHKC